MIYVTAGEYVISSHGCWLPGTYATQRAARWAFKFSDEDLAVLRDRVKRPITTEDLANLKKELRG